MPKAGTRAFGKLRAEAFGSLAALFILPMTKEAASEIARFVCSGPSRGIFGTCFVRAVPSFFAIFGLKKTNYPFKPTKPVLFKEKKPSNTTVLPFCRPPYRHGPKRRSYEPSSEMLRDRPYTAYRVTLAVKDAPTLNEEFLFCLGKGGRFFVIRPAGRDSSSPTRAAAVTLTEKPSLAQPAFGAVSRWGQIWILRQPIARRRISSRIGSRLSISRHDLHPFIKQILGHLRRYEQAVGHIWRMCDREVQPIPLESQKRVS